MIVIQFMGTGLGGGMGCDLEESGGKGEAGVGNAKDDDTTGFLGGE